MSNDGNEDKDKDKDDDDTDTNKEDANERVDIEIEELIKNKQTTDTNTDTNRNTILYEEEYDQEEEDDDDNENDHDNVHKVDDVPIHQQVLPTLPSTCTRSTPAIQIHTATKLLQVVHENPTCAICLEVFESDDQLIFCSNSIQPHCFHQECSLDYFCSHSDGVQAPCPLCRQPFLLGDDECCSSSTSTSNNELESKA
eukprot:CAMPEP_0170982586 /NCGR_PEP_ID=MMETSP0736-20130129/3710_1 /TAXON_ID=186038 /ORGANISM="Fragilariopsis kerguelensis, Strain L26-C5" /LENGTH=197 /DNA_ID=CAMNT_0011405829 /DNA_START=98 /DNA_END=692 /DNA_ORIENTATION=-